MSELAGWQIKCMKCKSDMIQPEGSHSRFCEKCRFKKNYNKPGENYVRKKRVMKKEMKITTGRCRFCEKEFTVNAFTAYSPNRTKQYCSQTCRTKFYNLPHSIMATKLQIIKLQKRLDVLTGIKNRSIDINPNQ